MKTKTETWRDVRKDVKDTHIEEADVKKDFRHLRSKNWNKQSLMHRLQSKK